MRIFNNLYNMVNEVERDLSEMGITYVSKSVQDEHGEFKTLELINYAYRLTNVQNAEMALQERQTPKQLAWMQQELDDRLYIPLDPSLRNPGVAWSHNFDFWKPMQDAEGKFSYTYADRWPDQIEAVVNLLKERPDTRHAIIDMWQRNLDWENVGGKKRVPCSLNYQFLLRNDELHLAYHMRSCDFKKFFLMDVWMTWCLGQYVADCLGVKFNSLTHFIGSLHMFERDAEGVF